MKIKTFANGMLNANCYIVHNEDVGFMIDPCVKYEQIKKYVDQNGIELKCIIITHAHIDHIIHLDIMREKFGISAYIHEKENDFLTNDLYNGARLFGMNKTFQKAEKIVHDGEVIEVDDMKIKVLWTPGHSPGGICLLMDDVLFSGDTLFYQSIGRTDLGKGDFNDLMISIKEKLFSLDDKIVVYPGHGKKQPLVTKKPIMFTYKIEYVIILKI